MSKSSLPFSVEAEDALTRGAKNRLVVLVTYINTSIMAFERPITIREAIERVSRRDLLLPAIQREFVWRPEQIVRLFDSLLRDYPIGSFLFWQVSADKKQDYQFYEFLRDYHERDATHNPKASLTKESAITAVLDGQQRLTSLYIGLAGTYSERKKHGWKRYDSNYPRKRLYLNVSRPSEASDIIYEFRFREDSDDVVRENADCWFRVGHILDFRESVDLMDFLIDNGLVTDKYPKSCLTRLHRAVMDQPVVNFYNETDQDLDKVLNIFIRVNSAGTELSYSDLLLSIATAQWEERDAREEIHGLVDQINRDYGDFAFSRDFVLKCCLMLADIDIRWRVENFNRANMARIETLWPAIASTVRGTVRLLAALGFSGSTLSSANAVIPIVYYLFKRGNPAGFVEAAAFRSDRETIQRWLNIVLLKRTFGGVPDNVLRPMRDVIRGSHESFPAESIADALRATPYSLGFGATELEGLLDAKYGAAYAFPVLALLYPDLDFRNRFHQDHIHPKSLFTRARLVKRDVPEQELEFFLDAVDRLPNLQLLEGLPNIEKSNRPFSEWLDEHCRGAQQLALYRQRHFIPDADLSLVAFRAFFDARKAAMLDRLRRMVGIADEEHRLDVAEDPLVAPASFHFESIQRVEAHLSAGLAAGTDRPNRYATADGLTRVVCLVSKEYGSDADCTYWYTLRPSHIEFLDHGGNGFLALGCGSGDRTMLLPWTVLRPLLIEMNVTEREGEKHYHIKLHGVTPELRLGLPVKGRRLDVSSYMLAGDVTQ